MSEYQHPPYLPGETRVKYIIHFVDNGQDFLRWGIDRHGFVKDCQPFQGWLWVGRAVSNLRELLVWHENDARCPGSYSKPTVELTDRKDRSSSRIRHLVTKIEVLDD